MILTLADFRIGRALRPRNPMVSNSPMDDRTQLGLRFGVTGSIMAQTKAQSWREKRWFLILAIRSRSCVFVSPESQRNLHRFVDWGLAMFVKSLRVQ